ncbi:MAG: reverse transcriptase family protein, partial [Spirochaetales bacterium]|nr:reverse transcriptase family protein [Spirochaetales bacterium]
MDIKDFFPNIKRERVENLFHSLDFYEPVPGKHAEILSIICTKDNALPQGAATSPAISNIIFGVIDKEIVEICGANNVIYTRYADDLTLSGDCKKILLDTVWKVKEAIKLRGFRINRRKSRMMSGG